MWVRGFIVRLIIVSSILQLVFTKPYLHNALITLASASSSSASSGSTAVSSSSAKLTNIADLTRKQNKVQQLQNEKQLAENVDIENDPYETDANQASPNLIQKKINKFLSKIQLLSSFPGSIPSTTTESEHNSTDIPELRKSKIEIKFDEITTQKPKVAEKDINPGDAYGEPLKISLEINDVENITNTEHNIDRNESDNMNRIGQFGIFFVELFGSLVGLAYGAVAHINNAIQGGTKPETAI